MPSAGVRKDAGFTLNFELAPRGFNVGGMKRVFVCLTFTLLCFARSAETQDGAAPANPAAAIAAKEGAEERYERMAADVQALQSANEALQTKINQITAELQELRSQQAQTANNSAAQDQLKSLADKIAEVDRKRQEDKQAIAEEIRKSMTGLEKSLATSPPPARAPVKPTNEADPAAADKGFLYVVQSGDSLSVIVKTYNADFKSKGLKQITLKQAKDANPGVDWSRLRVGQKIIIPRPEP
jgi:Skp family chaperone for outer membrane proteins